MSRHHDPDVLDPAERAELEALDAALAGDPAGTEWAALVAAVRDAPPAARPAARRALDERVAAGFPRRRPGWPRLPALHGAPVPALAVTLLVLLCAGAIGLAASGGREDQPQLSEAVRGGDAGAGAGASDVAPSAGAADSGQFTDPAAPSAASSAPLSTPVPPATPQGSFAARDRKVVRTTSLALATTAGKLQEVASGIVRATQDLGGVVETSRVDSTDMGGSGSFVLRVPTARLPDALKRYGELADVRRLTQGAEDVTAAFVSAQDRLSDARAERKALLGALGRATTPRTIASLRARIAGNRAAIARLEGDLRGLRRRTDTARIDATLSAGGSAAAAREDNEGAWGPADAVDDAGRVLSVVVGVALVAGAVLVPVAVLGGGAALAGHGMRRRRRDAALGGA